MRARRLLPLLALSLALAGVAIVSAQSPIGPTLAQAPIVPSPSSGNVGDTLLFGSDTYLVRDAANNLAQRNGTNNQTLRIYGTYTNATNYARLNLFAGSAGEANVYTSSAGTGPATDLVFGAGGSSQQWKITAAAGHLVAYTDNTYDIGASGANRPRNLYV
ncbi:MAG TPA: hypothetical protein VE714_07230, partial [Gemmatimonadales bacterium]|nr:hypothetical protein [Gemmatimonadales bacterium]